MEQLQWSDSLSIGVEIIDRQHKTWIEHYNTLVSAVETRQGPREIAQTLGFLVDYTKFHFDAEEKQMADSGFPAMAEHQNQHAELQTALGRLVDDFQEEGATHILADFLQTFLGAWLVDHIGSVDMEFGEHLREKGIELTEEE
ncbi:MAG: bacteriohemerythrin [Phycisphaerae bacterium]|jgi:hemerythrin|nr:bacteriohemerythrin [Phycisphaerae bacterium]